MAAPDEVAEPAYDIDELRGLFLFEGLTDAQLSRLCADGTVQTLPAGLLCREGDPAEFFYVLLDGEITLSKRSGSRDIVMWQSSDPGVYCGAVAAFLLDPATPYENNATLTRPSRLLVLDAETVGRFLVSEFPMAIHLLIAHSHGRKDAHRIIDPHERLLQLGQLTAGLTHELNNPAAAAVRAAHAVRDQIAALRSEDSDPAVVELENRIAERAAQPTGLTPMQKSDLEEALGQWLEDHDVRDAWDRAATFVEAGLDVDWMEGIAAGCSGQPGRLDDVLRRLACTAETEQLLTEITDATTRISSLVELVNQYSQLDKAPSGVADVHDLLDSTLTMFSHRLGDTVTVVRDYDRGLPLLSCYPAELNQVWTNLIANALDAMASTPSGVLGISTRPDRDTVRVEVCDNGPGIPDDLLARVFDPFFTTKPVGEGTGLGLDIAGRIVARHGGHLWAESTPGNTRFITSLPL